LATATCDSVVTLNLTILSDPPINITASSYNVLKGHTIHLDATPSLSYLWTATGAILSDDTIQNPSAVINDSSWIYLKTTSNVGECISTDSVFIAISEVNAGSLPTDTLPTSTNDTVTCDGSYIYMPNAFTPNGDGLNDVFKIYGKNIAINRFEIFNRQGEMVFETNDVNTGWDGSYKGATTTGTYVYLIYYYSVCDAKIKMLTGDVVLIR
jgi:gliding motility-associated-like protein